MRGVDSFGELWERRTVIEQRDGSLCDLMALPDLVRAKKTQRDKDWPMIRRLVEAHYFENRESAAPEQVAFWFREMRSSQLLIELAQGDASLCVRMARERPLLSHALDSALADLERGLKSDEETDERQKDRLYWLPLRRELEELRHPKAP
jgi:hypothetical protein